MTDARWKGLASVLDASGLRTVTTYIFNPACGCAWCLNGGVNPLPHGHPDTLGYDEPHIPLSWDAPSHLSPPTPGRPGVIFNAGGTT